MAQTDTPKLDVGDRFPSMQLTMLDGRTLQLPDELGDAEFTVFLGYRGKW